MRQSFSPNFEAAKRSSTEALDRVTDVERLLHRLNISPRSGFFGRLSPMGRLMLVMVATQLGIAEARSLVTEAASTPVEVSHLNVASAGQQRSEKPTVIEGREQATPHLEVRGLDQIHLHDKEFADRFGRLMAPFMDRATYRLEFTREQAELSDVYFGIQGQHGHAGSQHHRRRRTHAHHGQQRWIELAHHQVLENGDHALVMREAALEQNTLDIRAFCITAVHEVIHGLGREHLAYFVNRVKEADRIPFPYTEHFLVVQQHGGQVDYEHMGDEYRSKLLETFFAVGEIPAGVSFEDAVVQYICERYRVSEAGARRDVREVLSWFPAGFWDRMHVEYRAFVRDTGIEFETGAIQDRIILSLKDDGLRQALTDVLMRRLPSTVTRIYRLPTDAPDHEMHLFIRDVHAYHDSLVEQYELQLNQDYPQLVPFLQDWRSVVEFVAGRNRDHLQTLEHGDLPDGRSRMSDEQSAQYFTHQLADVNMERVNREWNALLPADRAVLAQTLAEYTRVIAHNFALPDLYAEQARRYLVN